MSTATDHAYRAIADQFDLAAHLAAAHDIHDVPRRRTNRKLDYQLAHLAAHQNGVPAR